MREKLHDIRRRVSESELSSRRTELLMPTNPIVFSERLKTFSGVAGDHVIDSPRAQFWRDAWVASLFSLHRKASRISLLEPLANEPGKVSPDFQIEVDDAWLRYEIVEAMPGRLRSAEIRADRQFGYKSRGDDIPDSVTLAAILSTVTSKKAERASKYSRCSGLVVYLNTAVSMSDADRKMAFIDGTYNAGKAFDEVWIIKAPEVYQVWSAGHAIFE